MLSPQLDETQIAQIRQIHRLEALRSAVYSLASESLDENIHKFVVSVEIEGDTLAAEISYIGAGGVVMSGGRL